MSIMRYDFLCLIDPGTLQKALTLNRQILPSICYQTENLAHFDH